MHRFGHLILSYVYQINIVIYVWSVNIVMIMSGKPSHILSQPIMSNISQPKRSYVEPTNNVICLVNQ